MSGDSLNTAELSAEELHTRLAEREHLVEELTSRLEQAAEQLDRMRRTGADRGGRIVGGVPPELIEQQQSLTEELQNAVQQWEDMQPAELLARVEMQVTELRDLIVNRLDGGSLSGGSASLVESLAAATGAQQETDGKPAAAKSSRPKPKNEGLSSYEAFKAGLLDTDDSGDADETDAFDEADLADAEETDQTDEPKQQHKPGESQPVEIPAVDPPPAIDVAAATTEDLRAAVDKRDSYIAYLIRRLRAAESSTRLSGSWSDLEGVPDELRSRLEEHEQKLEESLRLAEVETSLERARLGREAMRLEHLSHQLRKKAVQLGISDDDSEEDPGEEGADPEAAKKNGRWFRLFGK